MWAFAVSGGLGAQERPWREALTPRSIFVDFDRPVLARQWGPLVSVPGFLLIVHGTLPSGQRPWCRLMAGTSAGRERSPDFRGFAILYVTRLGPIPHAALLAEPRRVYSAGSH